MSGSVKRKGKTVLHGRLDKVYERDRCRLHRKGEGKRVSR